MSSATSIQHISTQEHTDRSVRPPGSILRRVGIAAYGVFAYGVGVAALVGVILLSLGVVDFSGLGLELGNGVVAVLFNLGLLVAFAFQHSVMARKKFKARWTRIIHPSMERSTYVLATGIVLIPLLALWQPMPTIVWAVESQAATWAILGLGVFGWAYLFTASFAINHFELFGLQQVYREFRGLQPQAVPFQERWMYRFDRHPIMTGVLLGLWATPTMTTGHLVFATGLTIYVMIGVHFEERALRREWGDTYEDYRRRVKSIVPVF